MRPSSLEALSLPFSAAVRWLRPEAIGDIADVEGTAGDDQDPQPGRLVLRWDGDESNVITAKELKPGDTIIVPASRGGIRNRCFDGLATEPVADSAERASLFGRGQPALRLQADVLKGLGLTVPLDDLGEVRSALALVANTEPGGWRKRWLERLAESKTSLVVDVDEPWTVLQGRRVSAAELRRLSTVDDSVEDGIELTTDDDDSFRTPGALGVIGRA